MSYNIAQRQGSCAWRCFWRALFGPRVWSSRWRVSPAAMATAWSFWWMDNAWTCSALQLQGETWSFCGKSCEHLRMFLDIFGDTCKKQGETRGCLPTRQACQSCWAEIGRPRSYSDPHWLPAESQSSVLYWPFFGASAFYIFFRLKTMCQWIGWREILQETNDFPIINPFWFLNTIDNYPKKWKRRHLSYEFQLYPMNSRFFPVNRGLLGYYWEDMGVSRNRATPAPSHHPFQIGIFHEINHPAMGVPTWLWKSHIYIYIHIYICICIYIYIFIPIIDHHFFGHFFGLSGYLGHLAEGCKNPEWQHPKQHTAVWPVCRPAGGLLRAHPSGQPSKASIS